MILVTLHFLLGRRNTFRDIKGQIGIGKWWAALFSVIVLLMSLIAIFFVMLSSFRVDFWDHYEKFEQFHSFRVKRLVLLLFFLTLAITQLFLLLNYIRHMDLKTKDCCFIGSGLALSLLSIGILICLITLLYYPDK